jgi:opacity protein-like surface antigen
MTRLARLATVVACSSLAAVQAQAQTPAAAGTDESRRPYLELNVAATVGHNASGSFGGEAGIRVRNHLDVFLEAGRMRNIATSELDSRAQLIATAVGAVSSAHYEVNFGDLGIRYRLPISMMRGKVQPYVVAGVGLAQVRANTTFTVAGAAVTPSSLGILAGSDLEGALKKPLLMLGGGETVTFKKRFFADATIRYGRIFPRTSQIDSDTSINTLRLQLGVGVRF